MRFMMLMIPSGYQSAEPTARPTEEMIAPMMRYNEELAKAGVLLGLDGLHPPSAGVRLHFSGGRARITDGPFAEAKEAVGGYWILEVKSKEEAVEWAARCPAGDGDAIEVRQIHEVPDAEAARLQDAAESGRA